MLWSPKLCLVEVMSHCQVTFPKENGTLYLRGLQVPGC